MSIIIRRIFIIFVMLTLYIPCLWSQEINQKNSLSLTAQVSGKKEAMILKTLDVEIYIHGIIAETKLTLRFYNPHRRMLEGEFLLPLPEGAFVNGYALDINGQMRDGVVVEKNKARKVFENIVRQGIDPGLMEWIKGNNFRTRIYPLLGLGTRTVSVSYISQLAASGNNNLLRLPIGFKKKVDRFSLNVKVIDKGQNPVFQKGVPRGLVFYNWGNSYRANLKLENYLLNDDLILQLNASTKPNIRVEKNKNDRYHFSVFLPETSIRKAQLQLNQNNSTPSFKRITILWDASGSMGKVDRKREIDLLRDYFSRDPDGRVTVKLIFFRNLKLKAKTFFIDNKGRGLDALIQAIKNVDYDGGTTLAAIYPNQKGKKQDCYFLFSDGLGNFGNDNAGKFSVPVYVFSAFSGANHSLLEYIANSSGGLYFNLLTQNHHTVLSGIGKTPYSFISAEYKGKEIASIYPHSPKPVKGRFILMGKLLTGKAIITLNFGVAGKIVTRIPVTISKDQVSQGNMLETLWAQQKITDLMVLPKRNRNALMAVGKQYGLVTPGTSLLVLETISQYIQYKIEPPESLPLMRKEYHQKMMRKEKERSDKMGQKLERIAQEWQQQITWWQRTFVLPKARKIQKKEVASMETTEGIGFDYGVEGGVVGGVIGEPLGRKVLPIMLHSTQKKANNARISITSWDPDTPYLRAIKAAVKGQAFKFYMAQKKTYGHAPAFYLDCADYFFNNKQYALGVQILSNIAEMELGNARLLRVLGHRLSQLGYTRLSRYIFEKVLDMRPEEPQSFRDLALVLAKLKQYKRALQLWYHIITADWDRFQGIEMIALMEMNKIYLNAGRKDLYGLNIDPRLIKMLDVDVRILLTWDTDASDMDLWVIDPTGQKSFYGHKLSSIGGHMSRDFTQGYGPEEYLLKKAIKGDYKIKVNYYGTGSQKLLSPVTLQVEIFTNYGRKNQSRKAVTLQLKRRREIITVGSVSF
jgi:tetratricopeptide (TPR) repeat protein